MLQLDLYRLRLQGAQADASPPPASAADINYTMLQYILLLQLCGAGDMRPTPRPQQAVPGFMVWTWLLGQITSHGCQIQNKQPNYMFLACVGLP